jgi:glutamate-1-semialdehyde 2,1-aminomutase
MNSHFVAGDVRRPEDVGSVDPRLRELLFFRLLDAGFYASPRGFIVLSLPVSDDDIDGFVDAIAGFVSTYSSLLMPATDSGGALLRGG